MFNNLDVFRTAMAMAQHAGHKQALSAQNMANADTPGYRAKDVADFSTTLRQAMMDQRATRPGHLNGSSGRTAEIIDRRIELDPNGNTISIEEEMVTAVAAKRQHDRALAIYRSNLSLIRSSIGRR